MRSSVCAQLLHQNKILKRSFQLNRLIHHHCRGLRASVRNKYP
ncbi:hypothetical protein PROPEN_02267 [Proteus penneri ATCC 35198]|nr:hypothetical protein PROPEN_02267 [Proteus penneri ATCC 35198]